MGNRGNIKIEQSDGALFLYTHWGGSDLCVTLATALDKGRSRWTDESYLTRIIFNELQGDDRSTTGFGIAVGHAPDNQHEIPTLSWLNAEHGMGLTVQYSDKEFTPDDFISRYLPVGAVQ